MNIYTIKVEEIDNTFEVCADKITCKDGKVLLYKNATICHPPIEINSLCGEFNNVEYFYIEADHGVETPPGKAGCDGNLVGQTPS